MNGAREFHRLIVNAHTRGLGGLEKTRLGYSNHGGNALCLRKDNVLYVVASHARGKTLHIYLIDEDDALFKVYGIVDGNSGWTESYGWLHRGTWVKPILAYLRQLARDIEVDKDAVEERERRKQSLANVAIGAKISRFNEMFREANV